MDVRGAVMASRGGGGGTELIYCQRLDVVIAITEIARASLCRRSNNCLTLFDLIRIQFHSFSFGGRELLINAINYGLFSFLVLVS